MGLREIADKIGSGATLDEWKDSITSAVEDYIRLSKGDVVEIVVGGNHAEELMAWVQGQGLRCGCARSTGGYARLAINLKMAPPPPRTPEEIQAEIDAAVERSRVEREQQATDLLTPRVAELEGLLAEVMAQLDAVKQEGGS